MILLKYVASTMTNGISGVLFFNFETILISLNIFFQEELSNEKKL